MSSPNNTWLRPCLLVRGVDIYVTMYLEKVENRYAINNSLSLYLYWLHVGPVFCEELKPLHIYIFMCVCVSVKKTKITLTFMVTFFSVLENTMMPTSCLFLLLFRTKRAYRRWHEQFGLLMGWEVSKLLLFCSLVFFFFCSIFVSDML